MLLHELKRLHQTNNLVHIAADGQVIARDLTQIAGGVDDEQGTQRNSVRKQDTVLGGDCLVEISNNWDFHVTQSTFGTSGVHPSKMGKEGITTGSNNLQIRDVNGQSSLSIKFLLQTCVFIAVNSG